MNVKSDSSWLNELEVVFKTHTHARIQTWVSSAGRHSAQTLFMCSHFTASAAIALEKYPSADDRWRDSATADKFLLKIVEQRENWEKQILRQSTSTASSRPCSRWCPRSSTSGSHGCWLWSSLDTYSTCNREAQLFWPCWGEKHSQSWFSLAGSLTLVKVKKPLQVNVCQQWPKHIQFCFSYDVFYII